MAVPEWLDGIPGAPAGSGIGSGILGKGRAPVQNGTPDGNDTPARHDTADPNGEIAQNSGAALNEIAAPGNCDALLGAAGAVMERCAFFFVPGDLARLDAALAHTLAASARERANNAASELDRGIRSGRSTESLAELAAFTSSAKAAASKAESQAALAMDVAAALAGTGPGETGPGGTAQPGGFDPDAVETTSGGALIEVISRLEEAKNAMAAVQAQAQTLFVAQQRLSQARAGLPRNRIGQGIAAQVGMARHESPHKGRRLCELAHVLVRELPHTMNAMTGGKLSEYRAGIIAGETVFLSLENRARVDELIAADGEAVARLGNRELAASTRRAAYALDPEVFVKRHEKAVGERHVTLRPAADGMTFLTALIPLKHGVRILATLTKVAESAKAAGDGRGKGQLMADSLMHRLTEHTPCDAGSGGLGDHRGPGLAGASLAGPGPLVDARVAPRPGAPCTTTGDADISLELVMTDRALFDGAADAAVLVGHDPIPAPLARMMVLGDGSGFSPRVWLKRLFTHPESNALLGMDSRSRLFPDGMKEFLRLQDQRCQTPYCDAPIREYDHIKAYAAGGPTTRGNGQGLCTACNHAKEAPGWASGGLDGPPGALPRTQVTTPTGHRYISTAPPLPGPASRIPRRRC